MRRSRSGRPSGRDRGRAETSGPQLALEHNGDLYCCDHFVEPDYLLDNINQTPMQQLIASARQTKFGQDKRDTLTDYCLATNRAPAELMQSCAAQDARRGRNERCACGSGRKWKHCHGSSC
jgi:uncharacterized protein